MEEQTFEVAFFRGGYQVEGKWIFPPSPVGRSLALDKLEKAVLTPRENPGHKFQLPSWSATQYQAGSKRGKGGVVTLSCLVLDYDGGITIDCVRELWAEYQNFGHTSYSHSGEKHKFRVVLPLQCPVQVENWPAIYAWARKTSPQIDKQCNDAGRMYFLPCQSDSYIFWRQGGDLLDLSHLRVPPPRPVAPRCTEYRPRDSNSVLDFDPVRRREVALLLGGSIRDNSAHNIRCPGCGDRSVWYFIDPTKKKTWTCSHKNSCAKFGFLRELL